MIIGGGAGGATLARLLAGALDVTLIEESARYTSCFFSNLYVGGVRDFASITHSYDTLAAAPGITLMAERAVRIEPARRRVVLADGRQIPYDRLGVAPGIDIIHDSVPGYSTAASETAPHAWQGGHQTENLKSRLDALTNGEHIVMVAPPNPYRCPPGPYERASMMAHVLKRKGFDDSRIMIIDTKSSFSKQALFTEGWELHYPGMIEWLPPGIHGGILSVDAENGTVETDFDTFEGGLLNIIPAQRAGTIAEASGLTDKSGFCPIEAISMRSRIDPAIFVIGDASIAGDMPKSAFSANSQARVAAAAHSRRSARHARSSRTRYTNTLLEPDLALTTESGSGRSMSLNDANAIVSISSFVSDTGESERRCARRPIAHRSAGTMPIIA